MKIPQPDEMEKYTTKTSKGVDLSLFSDHHEAPDSDVQKWLEDAFL